MTRSTRAVPTLAVAAALLLGVQACQEAGGSAASDAEAAATPYEVPTAFASTVQEAPTIQVYKAPTCGCCGQWIEHLRAEGFDVEAIDVNNSDLVAVKQTRGVDTDLMSCHTAIVGDYVVEGHVPASDIARLLAERPDIAGIAVPGMPAGSPGMESASPEPYDVLTFGGDGERRVWASH